MDDPIRELIGATRTDVESRIDVDGEWATFNRLDSQAGDLTGEPSAGRAWSRRWWWTVAAAAVTLAIVGGVTMMRQGETMQLVESTTPPVASRVGDPTAGPRTPEAPSTTEGAPVLGEDSSNRVTFREPPPELVLQSLGTVQVPALTVGGYRVAIGDLGVAVGSWSYGADGSDRIQVLGFDGTARTVDVGAGLGGIIAYGPGDVAYSTRQGDSNADFSVVAVALSGERAGTVVAEEPAPILRYSEYPPSSFGHGETGVIMRRDNGTTAIGYVDINGEPTTLGEPAPPFYTADDELQIDDLRGRVDSSMGASWQIEAEAAMDRAGSYVGPSPPAPTSGGVGVYWTHTGPNLAPDTDFGEPSMWVVARLAPDGTVSWWSVPAGWAVATSDLWGTVLAKLDGEQLELALASAPVETSTTAVVTTTSAPGSTGTSSSPSTSAAVTSTTEPVVEWEPVPIEVLPRLDADAVPRLALSDPDLPAPLRVEFSEPPEANVDFVQVFGTADGSGWMHIETSTRPQDPLSSWIEGEPIGPWSTHTSPFDGPDDHTLRLTTGYLTVFLWSNTINVDQLRVVATWLRQGETSTTGWSVPVLPDGFEPVVEGPSYGGAVYSINYQDSSAAPFGLAAALEISVDSPSLLSTYFMDHHDFDIVNVNGHRAVLLAGDGVAPPTLKWEYQPRIVARLGIPDVDVDTLIAVAESIREVDADTWEQMATTTPSDGCPHFWC